MLLSSFSSVISIRRFVENAVILNKKVKSVKNMVIYGFKFTTVVLNRCYNSVSKDPLLKKLRLVLPILVLDYSLQ